MVLHALEDAVLAREPKNRRTIATSELFQHAMTTSITADEILTKIRLPVIPTDDGYAIKKFSRRHSDFAIAAITA